MSQPIIDTPENWDAASSGYAQHIAPRLMESFSNEFVDSLDLNDSHNVLEVACGSGALTSTLASRSANVLATDFAPSMIREAQAKMTELGVENVRFEEMDGQALDLDDNSFDRAACNFGVMLFPDKAAGFSELHRVLKPGGKAMVSAWAGPEQFEALGIFMGAIRTAFPDMPKPPAPPPVFSLSDIGDFKSQMSAAGFQDIQTRYVTREMSLEDFATMWTMLTIGAPPVRILFEQVGDEGKAKIKETLSQIIADRFGSGPIVLSNSATLGIGVK